MNTPETAVGQPPVIGTPEGTIEIGPSGERTVIAAAVVAAPAKKGTGGSTGTGGSARPARARATRGAPGQPEWAEWSAAPGPGASSTAAAAPASSGEVSGRCWCLRERRRQRWHDPRVRFLALRRLLADLALPDRLVGFRRECPAGAAGGLRSRTQRPGRPDPERQGHHPGSRRATSSRSTGPGGAWPPGSTRPTVIWRSTDRHQTAQQPDVSFSALAGSTTASIQMSVVLLSSKRPRSSPARLSRPGRMDARRRRVRRHVRVPVHQRPAVPGRSS